MPTYSIIVPVYNEELVIEQSYKRLSAVMENTKESYELIFVNDGSHDETKNIIVKLCKADKCVKLIDFSRNFGHQSAVTAGMDFASGKAVVIIDADLQDPPEVILNMIDLWKQGYDVVYGVRNKREGETHFKKATAKIYYRLLKNLTNVDIPVDTGDFRLMDRKVCEAMKKLGEKNRYVRGLVSWVGFKQTGISYVRNERFAGETKYPLKKMIKFAIDGITALSYKPLKLASGVGFVISLLSFGYLAVVIFQKLVLGNAIQGWASTVAIILFSQGIVLMMLGLMGEYIGRIYDEVKNRPNYLVQELMGFNNNLDNGFNSKDGTL